MHITNFRLGAAEYGKIQQVLASLASQSQVRTVFLVNRNGQEIARVGKSDGIDGVALSTLAAGCLAATFGLANLVGESEFDRISLTGEAVSLLVCPAGVHALLVCLISANLDAGLEFPKVRQAALVLDDLLGRCTDRVTVIDGK